MSEGDRYVGYTATPFANVSDRPSTTRRISIRGTSSWTFLVPVTTSAQRQSSDVSHSSSMPMARKSTTAVPSYGRCPRGRTRGSEAQGRQGSPRLLSRDHPEPWLCVQVLPSEYRCAPRPQEGKPARHRSRPHVPACRRPSQDRGRDRESCEGLGDATRRARREATLGSRGSVARRGRSSPGRGLGMERSHGPMSGLFCRPCTAWQVITTTPRATSGSLRRPDAPGDHRRRW